MMWRAFLLLLPALMPSWSFFKAVEPSPRVQWRLCDESGGTPTPWRPYRARPDYVGIGHMLRCLFWNPRWNETLYMVSLAERLVLNPSAHSEDEINRLLAAEMRRAGGGHTDQTLQFQLIFISEEDGKRARDCTYTSSPVPLRSLAP